MAASFSSTVGSMTSLAKSAGLLLVEGVGELGMIIGLVGEFGGVDSREEGICVMSRMVRGMRITSGSVIPGIGIVSESEVGSSNCLVETL